MLLSLSLLNSRDRACFAMGVFYVAYPLGDQQSLVPGFLPTKGHGKKVKWPPVTGPFLTVGKHKDKLACLLFPLSCSGALCCVCGSWSRVFVWTVLSAGSQSKVEHWGCAVTWTDDLCLGTGCSSCTESYLTCLSSVALRLSAVGHCR